MKKVLFASTALVAFAGAASAEVLLSGQAEMGLLVGDGGVAPTDGKVEFFTDIDVTFTMSGETDGGLTFGANIDLDESDGGDVTSSSITTRGNGPDGIPNTGDDTFTTTNSTAGSGASPAFSPRSQGGESIFISGAFGTLTAGDTDGALDWALQESVFNSGSLGDDETEQLGFNGNSGLDGTYGGQIVRYQYSVGDFGIAVSAEISDAVRNVSTDADPVLGIGVKYSLDFAGNAVGLGLGYQVTQDGAGNDADALGFSINGTVYGFAVGLSYMMLDRDNDDANSYDHLGLGAGYSLSGGIELSANYGNYDYDDGTTTEGFGLTAGYDLGGGAKVLAGYGHSNPRGADNDFDTFSFGVQMSF